MAPMSASSRPADTPAPPYWAVIFSSTLSADTDGYDATAARMVELAAEQPGYLGFETARDADGLGVTVSYWREREHIAAWRAHAEHTIARELGVERWYASYRLRIARVEAAVPFDREAAPG